MKRRMFSLFMVLCLLFAFMMTPGQDAYASGPSSALPATELLGRAFYSPASPGAVTVSSPAIVLSPSAVTVDGCFSRRDIGPSYSSYISVDIIDPATGLSPGDDYTYEIISSPGGDSDDVRLTDEPSALIWRSIRPGTVEIKATPVSGSGLSEEILSLDVSREPDRYYYSVFSEGFLSDGRLYFYVMCHDQYVETAQGWYSSTRALSGSAIFVTDALGNRLTPQDGVTFNYSDPIVIYFNNTVPSGAYTFNDSRCFEYLPTVGCPDVTDGNVMHIYAPDMYEAVLDTPIPDGGTLTVSGASVTTELPFACHLVEKNDHTVDITTAASIFWRIQDENNYTVNSDEARIDPDTGLLTVYQKLRDRCAANTTTLKITGSASLCSASININVQFPENSAVPSDVNTVTGGAITGETTGNDDSSSQNNESDSSSQGSGSSGGQGQTDPSPATPGGTVSDPGTSSQGSGASGSGSSGAGSSSTGSGSSGSSSTGSGSSGSSGSGSSGGTVIQNTPTPAPSLKMYVPAIGVPTETPAETPKDDAEPSSAPANNGKTTKNSDGSVTRTTVTTNPDGTVTTTTTRTYKDGSYTLKAVTRDSDDKVISTTESSVSFTSDGTKVEESKTTGSDGSARVFLEKTTKKGKVTSEETNTSAEGVVTIVMKTQKTDGTDVVKAFLKKSEGKVKLTSFKTNVSTAVIPASITANGKTYNVTMIGNNAMIDNDVIKTLKIGKNITSIGRNAFKSNDRLDTIVIYSTKIKDVGIYAIRGISPDAVVKIKSDKETFRSIRKKIRESGADRSLTYKRLKVAAE